MRFDVQMALSKAKVRDISKKELSHLLGITRQTLFAYLKKPDKMPYGVAARMATILSDDSDEAKRMFCGE